jgi:hypothetical protein
MVCSESFLPRLLGSRRHYMKKSVEFLELRGSPDAQVAAVLLVITSIFRRHTGISFCESPGRLMPPKYCWYGGTSLLGLH